MHPKQASLKANTAHSNLVGTELNLTCNTESTGQTTYIFLRNDTEIKRTIPGVSSYVFNTLITDSGVYTCVASIDGVNSSVSQSLDISVIGELCSVDSLIINF